MHALTVHRYTQITPALTRKHMDCAVKKKPGRLNLSLAHISWRANDGSANESLKIADVKGMQATPPTAAKMRIKLTTEGGQALMLEFNKSDDLEKSKHALQTAIKNYRESNTPQSSAGSGSGEAPASAAGAAQPAASESSSSAPVSSSASKSAAPTAQSEKKAPQAPQSGSENSAGKTKVRKFSLDPAKLLQNLDLQRSILRQDPDLMKTFQQTVIASGALSNEQFWSLRINLLVTAAQLQVQTRGSYNVLSTIKPTTGSDNKVNINLTREKIVDVFDQYPLVRRAYNENVPKLSEGEFWQRFFMSRLFLVLKGEKVSPTHSTDAIFDPYIDVLQALRDKRAKAQDGKDPGSNVPLFVNVEANDYDNPETYGNNLITTAGGGTKNLIRSVNGLSQRLLLGKRKRDQGPPPEQTKLADNVMDELKLHDLEPDQTDDHSIQLHIDSLRGTNADDPLQNQRDKAALEKLSAEFYSDMPSKVDLSVVGDDPDSLGAALNELNSLTPQNEVSTAHMIVSGDVQLVHTTTQEFLRQFWHAYTNNREQCVGLRSFLQKSLERIAAVNNDSLNPLVASVNRALQMPI